MIVSAPMRASSYSYKARVLALVFLFVAGGIGGFLPLPGEHAAAAPPIPTRLTDEEFWTLSTSISETDGTFRSDNLLSNELNFQYVLSDLLSTAKPDRIYMGVGPEQNFTYIAALRPAMAFIVDIRHGNLDVHLMYKALFELSANRAEFVSRLFSRKMPEGLNPDSTAVQLFRAVDSVEPSQELYEDTLKEVIDHLKTDHKFPLSAGDLDGIEWALWNYYIHGPQISYNSSDTSTAPNIVGVENGRGNFGRRGGNLVTYEDLMTATDGRRERSYLASEENFRVLKDLESKNLLVPVVGDFGGPKAIREVGKYLKSIGGMVSAFYLSNVEQYLSQDGKMPAFLASVSTLPIDETSRFIRSGGGSRGFGGGRGVMNSGLGYMLEESRPYSGR